jgi:hypothetical protein
LSDSSNDEKLARLLAEHGPEGYGVWWLIVETIAKQISAKDMKVSVSYPVSYWLRITGVYHHKKFKKLVESMNDLCLISAQSIDNLCNISSLSPKDVLIISVPNILKFRDEYLQKSGQKTDSVLPV